MSVIFLQDLRVPHENGPDGRHLVFYTAGQWKKLRRSKKVQGDGTFKAIRAPFVQLFILHAFLKSGDCLKQVPLCYVLMSSRKRIDYVALFEFLQRYAADEGTQLEVSKAT